LFRIQIIDPKYHPIFTDTLQSGPYLAIKSISIIAMQSLRRTWSKQRGAAKSKDRSAPKGPVTAGSLPAESPAMTIAGELGTPSAEQIIDNNRNDTTLSPDRKTGLSTPLLDRREFLQLLPRKNDFILKLVLSS
jgi:hypothetical protein